MTPEERKERQKIASLKSNRKRRANAKAAEKQAKAYEALMLREKGNAAVINKLDLRTWKPTSTHYAEHER